MAKKKQHLFLNVHIGDFGSEPLLKVVGPYARAIFFDILMVVARAEKFGYLIKPTGPYTMEEMALVSAAPVKQVADAIKKLIAEKLLMKDEDGVIFVPKMVEEAKFRAKQAKFGKKGQKVKEANERAAEAQAQASAPTKSDKPVKRDKITFDGVQWFPSDLVKYLKKAREEIQRHGLALEEISDPEHRAEVRDNLKKLRTLEQGILDAIRNHPWDPKAKTKIEYDGLQYYPGELIKELENLQDQVKGLNGRLSRTQRGDITAHNVCYIQSVP